VPYDIPYYSMRPYTYILIQIFGDTLLFQLLSLFGLILKAFYHIDSSEKLLHYAQPETAQGLYVHFVHRSGEACFHDPNQHI